MSAKNGIRLKPAQRKAEEAKARQKRAARARIATRLFNEGQSGLISGTPEWTVLKAALALAELGERSSLSIVLSRSAGIQTSLVRARYVRLFDEADREIRLEVAKGREEHVTIAT